MADDDREPGKWTFSEDTDDKGNRATVRLVSEQVKSVERLIDAGFKDIQRQLDNVSGLPERVTRLEEQMKHIQRETDNDEQREADKRTWKRGLLTAAGLAIFGTLLNLAITGHLIHASF